jgi:hypothetical protein
MNFPLLVFALATTLLFSLIFVPIFFAAWRQEEEYWKRHNARFAALPMAADRHG